VNQQPRHYSTQLAVVGSGLAGVAAAIFAQACGITTAQVGNTGAVAYTTGYLDLLGYHRDELLDDPWQGLQQLRLDEPEHPYSSITEGDIESAFANFTEALTAMGIGYTEPGRHNLTALTPIGTSKPTLSVPCTMQPGIDALAQGRRTLIIDFVGLQGFSARELVTNLRHAWPQLSATRLPFPDMESGAQLYPEVMARALEVAANRQRLAERIRAVLGDAEVVGMPAIMGMHAPDQVHAALQKLVGVPLFEIPTMPPAVPGIRLREMLEQQLPARGITLIPQQKVKRLELGAQGATLYLKDSYGDVVIDTASTLLATGRFLSGGLQADRGGVREALLGIPVSQPEGRAAWYRQHYLDPAGHPVNRSGIEVDGQFHPLGNDGQPVNSRLFAAGVVLAHQDWIRQRCGAGVAIATAWKAVQAIERQLNGAD